MKRILLLAIMATSIWGMQAQHITFEKQSHDYGQIMEADGPVSCDFKFTNTGDKPLIIKQVVTGCGCTSAKWEAKGYKPGEKGVVRVTYNPANRKATSLNIVTEVFTNAESPVTLVVTGKVTTEKHSYLNIYDPTKGERKPYKEKKPADDYEVVLQRVRERLYVGQTPEDIQKRATSLMKMMDATGKWPEYDYKCFFRTKWEPQEHLNRLRTMAIAYTCPISPLYGNQVLFKAIDKGMRAWNESKPSSFNWWYNQISAPKVMADILALMEAGESKVSASVTKGFMTMMEQSDPRKWTGANKMDIAIHHLVRGCVLKNDSIVTTNVAEFFQPLCITDGEGIKEDLSYQQHNAHLYIGGYGTVLIDNISKTAGLFTGTKFALPKEQKDLFSRFVRETYLNVFRSKFIDFSVCGRSISRENMINYGVSDDLFARLKNIDPEHAQEYDEAAYRFANNNAAYKRKSMNKMFYCSDYMLQTRPRYDMSVRAVSKRTCRMESGNGENLWGTYVSEGATSIRVQGDEYYNIFPVWEWDKIPGTTTAQGEVEDRYEWGVAGVADFVGGVSNGNTGVMTYLMNDYGLTAHKGYFMFNNEMVCLGAGINGGEGKDVTTSVNQCNLGSEVYMGEAELSAVAASSNMSQQAKGWIWHNKVGYYFPEESALCMKNGMQTGSWSKINFNLSNDEVKKGVFNLWIDHGANPKDAKYAYVVVPGVASPNSLKVYNTSNIEIISNTTSVQAVGNKQMDELQAIFYEPGTVTFKGKTVSANKPCVVLIDGVSTGSPKIQITDPTQKEKLDAASVVSVK